MQPSIAGGVDAFVTKLNSSGTPVYSTYLGATSTGNGIAADSSGNAYVTGQSTSIPLVNPIQSTNEGSAFVSKLNPAGSGIGVFNLLWHQYLCGLHRS